MNTISSSVSSLTMEGQNLYAVRSESSKPVVKSPVIQSGAEVAQSIEKNMAELKADIQQIEKLAESTSGRKLQFNVNKELKQVIVRIVDSNTNQVVKEIPSEDMVKLKIRIRKAIGSLYDKMV
ncbi:MAG: flagellar protein FlaG [Treponema sp.]|nr:flagellar protein FlaG [Treponema sp.]